MKKKQVVYGAVALGGGVALYFLVSALWPRSAAASGVEGTKTGASSPPSGSGAAANTGPGTTTGGSSVPGRTTGAAGFVGPSVTIKPSKAVQR